MTAVHSSVPAAPAPRTGSPAPSTPAVPAEVLDLLRAAEAFGNAAPGSGAAPSCAGSVTCRRPGALTVVTDQGTSELCGLHAMNVVFSVEGGPMVVVRPEA